MERTRTLVTGPLVGRVGRLVLLGAVLFWWGGVVVPNLVSLAFPEWLPPEAIPRDLNPDIDYEGRLANRVSGLALFALAVLAALNVAVGLRRSSGRIFVGGWSVLAVTAAFLALEESTEVHSTLVPSIGSQLLGFQLVPRAGPYVWVLLLSPLIVAFTGSMVMFCLRGLRDRAVRTPLAIGLATWLFALLCEGITLVVFRGRASDLMLVLEETLEFGGTLLIATSAATALARTEPVTGAYGRRRVPAAMLWSIVVVLTLGGLFVGLVFRAPLVDARATAGYGVYWVSLEDQQSVAQGFRMPAAPVSRLSVRLANRDPAQRSGVAIWRVIDAVDWTPGSVLREGRLEVPAGDLPAWVDVDFPLLTADEGRQLFVQVVAEIEPPASLRVGMVKGNRFEDGRLWVNGELTWPDQDLAFVAHGAPELTRSKVLSLWRMLTSGWHWPAQVAKAAAALMLVTMIPALLIPAAWPRRRVGGIPLELR